MEDKINQLLRLLQLEYGCLWALSLLLVALYESNYFVAGGYVGDAQAAYLLQCGGILLAVGLIPLALRIFSFSLVKRIRFLNLEEALKSYRRWSEIRMGLLLAPLLINLSSYYLTLDNMGLLCASMTLIASLFCLPSRSRLENELDLIKEEA